MDDDDSVNSVQQDFTFTVECNAGPDGVLTLSIPGPTPSASGSPCPPDSNADGGDDDNSIHPYPGDGINPAANCDIIPDDAAESGNDPSILPAPWPSQTSNRISSYPDSPAATDAPNDTPDSASLSVAPPGATSAVSSSVDSLSASDLPCSTDQDSNVDSSDPAGQNPQTGLGDGQAPAPSSAENHRYSSGAVPPASIPVESVADTATDAVAPETVVGATSKPTSTFVESIPSDTSAVDAGEGAGGIASGDVAEPSGTAVVDTASWQAPASEVTLWPIPSSYSPVTTEAAPTLDTSLSIVTDETTMIETTITFVKAQPPSG